MLGFKEKCEGCKKIRFYVKNRSYNFKNIPNLGKITSQGKLCRICFLNVKKMVI